MISEKGYTLVETLVVLAIMAALSAIAIPFFYKWTQSASCKEAAWGIVAQMKLGKQMALSTNLEHRVEFDLDGKKHRLTRGNLSSGSASWTGVSHWSDISNEVRWSSGSACDGTADLNVLFRPNGSAETAVMCIKDAENALKYRVSVTAASGRAVIN